MKDLPTHVDDGYTQPGYLKGEPRMHGPLRFKFRACLPAERHAWWDFEERHDRAPTADPAKKAERKLAILKKHVFDVERVERLHPNLFDRLFNVALGAAAPDEDPDAPAEPAGDDAKN